MITLYNLILYYLLCFPALTSEALCMICARYASVYAAIRKACKNGHILKRQLQHGRHTTSYLEITSDGIRHLIAFVRSIETDYIISTTGQVFKRSEWEWIARIDPNIDSLRLRAANVKTESMIRFCAISQASIMMRLVGMHTHINLLPQKISSTLCEVIKSAYYEGHPDHHAETELNYPLKDPAYFNAKLAKMALLDYLSPSLVQSGKFAGYLVKRRIVFAVYVGSKTGFVWNRITAKRELDCYDCFRHNVLQFEQTGNKPDTNAIFLIQNAKMFYDLIADSAKKNRNKQGMIATPVGTGYDHFAVFPISYEGANLLRLYLTCDPKRSTEMMKNISHHAFPPETANRLHTQERKLNYGIIMDTKKIIEMIRKHKNETFEMICLDWQIDFYTRIFDIQTIEMLDSLNKMNFCLIEARVKPEIASLYYDYTIVTDTKNKE